jgi:hypothetical protein
LPSQKHRKKDGIRSVAKSQIPRKLVGTIPSAAFIFKKEKYSEKGKCDKPVPGTIILLVGVKHFALWPLAQAADSCFDKEGNGPTIFLCRKHGYPRHRQRSDWERSKYLLPF